MVETAKGAVPFKNVILDYPLGKAMADGFVKEPAVVTRKNFNPAGMTPEAIETMKLQDGIRLHEQVKVELETYARESGNFIVKPFVLVIARDTTHAKQLIDLIQSEAFFEGRYKTKVIQVDSSKTGAEEDEMVERLLKVEQTDEPDGNRHPRQHAEGRLGRDEPLHDHPVACGECPHPHRAIHRPRPAPALRQAHRRQHSGPAEHHRPRQVSGNRRTKPSARTRSSACSR
jgi:hypothetical protein